MSQMKSKELMKELLEDTVSNYEDDVYDSSDLISTLLSLEEDYGVKGIFVSVLGIDEDTNIVVKNNILSIGEILGKYSECEFEDDDLLTIFYNVLDDYSLLVI